MPILPITLEPLVRRLLAPNPSPFTYTGTQTYIVGRGEVVVIDPGPDLPEHVPAILSATEDERVRAILCTHTHRDHSPASRALQAVTGAPIIGCAPLTMEDDGPRADAAFDADYRPDHVLADGEAINVGDVRLEAVATPGHTSNHLCFALPQTRALFSGDHIMGWSTTVVSPPDGDMAAYMRSLEKLLGREDDLYYPAHGDPVKDPLRFVRAVMAHRRQRERQILDLLEQQSQTIPEMVSSMYRGIEPRLHGAAGRSVLAHLIDLESRDRVWRDGDNWAIAA